MNKWPKLLITHMDELNTSYWHIQSEEHLHKFCLDWVEPNIDIGYYSYDTLG